MHFIGKKTDPELLSLKNMLTTPKVDKQIQKITSMDQFKKIKT